MKQVVVTGLGQVKTVDVPAPLIQPGHILARTAYSLISTGTERDAIRARGVPLAAAERARAWRRLTRQVRSAGIGGTVYRLAQRLRSEGPLGYSLAGWVIEVSPEVRDLRVGDLVACSGAEHAVHAEVVSVPRHLAAPVPDGVPLPAAAFAGVGAIALQAVRRSEAAIGETVVVSGLGLVGLLTCLVLRQAGCVVIGVEPDRARAPLAQVCGAVAVLHPDEDPIAERVRSMTGGLGADAVIVCAATTSSAPVNQAAGLVRERGRVVVVGQVGMALDREPFYRKELDLLMSRSLGPGRYDPAYEDLGRDYPAAYVRWTENRNMAAFLHLVAGGAIDVRPLIAGEASVDDAAVAYDRLRQAAPPAMLLRYAPAAGEVRPVPPLERIARLRPDTAPAPGRIGAGLIGAGRFAGAVHLPLLGRSQEFALRAVASRRGLDARRLGLTGGVGYVTTDPEALFRDPRIDVVWIVTPHDSHAELAVAAVQAGKHVFVEKPLALSAQDCSRVADAVQASGRLLTVGFNRRFAPASVLVQRRFAAAGPKQIVYRVRADVLAPDHWLDDPQRGGGRLLGEGVHFLDWIAWMVGHEPVRVWAAGSPALRPHLTVTMEFPEGSIGTLVYTTAGDPQTPKERVEVFGAGQSAVIDDFRTVTLSGPREGTRRHRAAGKGYEQQLTAFAQALRGQAPLPVTVHDGARATLCALAALTALREAAAQPITATWRT